MIYKSFDSPIDSKLFEKKLNYLTNEIDSLKARCKKMERQRISFGIGKLLSMAAIPVLAILTVPFSFFPLLLIPLCVIGVKGCEGEIEDRDYRIKDIKKRIRGNWNELRELCKSDLDNMVDFEYMIADGIKNHRLFHDMKYEKAEEPYEEWREKYEKYVVNPSKEETENKEETEKKSHRRR